MTRLPRKALKGPSSRSAIDSFIVMDVMREANRREAAGDHIIHMEVGQPSTPAPDTALAAARAALSGDRLGYTDALGMPALRTRIARHYTDWYGVDVPAERVVVTTGSSAGFLIAFLALFDTGDTVALPAPGYPCYRHILSALGMKSAIIACTAEHRWMPSLEQVSALGRETSGLLLASPANPTGTVLPGFKLEQLISCCEERGIRFISDEIYHGLTYGEPAHTALEYSSDAFVINSFSKYFSMTGWRIGWMVVPEEFVRPIERIVQNLYISAPTLSQIAALAAFDGREQLETYREAYVRNRDFLLEKLPEVGFDNLLPADGAFYIYADVSERTQDSRAFAERILREIGVAVTPGLDFDEGCGANYLRFSYAREGEDMEEAVRRFARWS